MDEFDSIVPNTQTPKSISRIGTPDNPWSEVVAGSGCFQSVVVNGSIISGSYDDAVHQEPITEGAQLLQYPIEGQVVLIEHGFGTLLVDVVVYDQHNFVVMPDSISTSGLNHVIISFVEPQSGIVLVQKGKS